MDTLAGPNDLVPSFKIFSMLIIITIAIKMIFQYSYNENAAPSFSDVTSLTDVSLIKDEIKKKDTSQLKKQVTVYFKSYIFYYLTLLWTVCLMITILSITLNKYDVNKPGCIEKMSMINLIPITMFMGLLGWIIYQNTIYYKKINSGHIAETYVTFDTAVNVLLLVQAALCMHISINKCCVHRRWDSIARQCQNTGRISQDSLRFWQEGVWFSMKSYCDSSRRTVNVLLLLHFCYHSIVLTVMEHS